MDWFERLYNGIVQAFAHAHDGPCQVVVHNDAQKHLGEGAIAQLARENGRKRDSVMLVTEHERPVGSHLCNYN